MKTLLSLAGLRAACVAAMLSLVPCVSAGDLKPVAPKEVPPVGTFFSLQNPDLPPMPLNPFPELQVYLMDGRFYFVDDRSVDYDAVHAEAAERAALEASLRGGAGPMGFDYSSNDLWLEVTLITNYLVFLRLHGTQPDLYYQLLSKTNLSDTGPWELGQVIQNTTGTNQLDYQPVPIAGHPKRFFRAVGADAMLSITPTANAVEPAASRSDPGEVGAFLFARDGATAAALTVHYAISGTAENGVDFTNAAGTALSGLFTLSANNSVDFLDIFPIEDALIEFEEPLTLTLVLTNNYVIDPNNARATITVNDNFPTNLFQIVATNVTFPVGIDYHPPTQSLVISHNFGGGSPNNFALIDSNGVVTAWSGVQDVEEEVKLATVKTSTNGFVSGEMFFGNGPGTIGWLSADGTVSNLTWATLSGETNNLRGGFYVDRTGLFGHELIAVAGDNQAIPSEKGIWRADANGNVTNAAKIFTRHLEGAITLPDDVQKWGPWAGKIITGDESAVDENGNSKPLIYSIDGAGAVASFALGIHPEDFDIIPTNHLYCTDHFGGPNATGAILKLSSSLLTDYVGDLLITQAGEFPAPVAKLVIVRWDSSRTNFVVRSISHADGVFEHVTFAPVNIPALAP